MLDIAVCKAFAKANVPVTLGVLQCSVTVTEPGQALSEALDKVASERLTTLSGGTVGDIAQISATRKAYKMLGKDPSRYRPSAEGLMRRLIQGKGIYRINNVVDTNNLISLETGLSLGCYRHDRLAPPVTFRLGRPGESYPAIGRGPINLEKLPLFADRDGPFGSPTSDSERTMIDLSAERILMVLIDFGGAGDLDARMTSAAQSLERFCAARDLPRKIISAR